MKNKLFYTQPTTDLLELRVEGGILTGSIIIQVFGDEGAPGANDSYNDAGDF